MNPFIESSDDESDFVSTMYNYYLDDLDEDDNVLHTRSAALNRNCAAAHDRLVHHYFADDCVYDLESFKRRFRVSRHIFLRIVNALESRYRFFQQRSDARGRVGFSALQ